MKKLNLKINLSGDVYQDEINDKAPCYDSELDNITSIHGDICELLSYQTTITFDISGFGQDQWPLDVHTDLLCGVEELNDIVECIIRDDYNFTFDLYEQGVERTLIFSEKNNAILIRCESSTDWQPSPEEIVMDKVDVRDMFLTLKSMYAFLANKVCPKISSHIWFQNWLMEPAGYNEIEIKRVTH